MYLNINRVATESVDPHTTRSILTKLRLKRKIPAHAAILEDVFKIKELLTGLYHRADALGAQSLADLTPTFIHADSLQIRFKGPQSSLLGPGTIPTKRCFLTATFALCHNYTSFTNFCD